MCRYVLTPQAEADLRGIIRYTLERHGERQALHYITALETHFDAIAANRAVSRPVSDRYPQVRVTRCEHHYVFYLHPDGQAPRILAVLHERMDLLPLRGMERCECERAE